MAGMLWSKFFWQDWRSDAGLRQCSLAARGLWMDMLCVAAQHNPIGLVAVNGEGLSVDGIARQAGVDPREAATLVGELERNDVFARDRKGIIYSRRMVRDAKSLADAKRFGKKGGNPALIPPDNPTDNSTLASSLLASQGKEEAFEEFWKSYPRRLGANPKSPAQKVFDGLVRSGVDPQAIIAGAKACATQDRDKIGTPYIPQAVKWLRDRRWEDYAKDNSDGVPPSYEVQARAWLSLLERERRTGQWGSKNIHKSEIPEHFITSWKANLTNIAQEAPNE